MLQTHCLLICTLGLLGCVPKNGEEPETGKVGGTVDESANVVPLARVSLSSKLTNLDVTFPAAQPDIVTVYLTSGRLFRLNNDGALEDELAESLSVSKGGLKGTVTLKKDLVYSDGTPVLAEDVAFAYKRNQDLRGPFFRTLLSPIERVKATDKHTVVFHLVTPYLDLGSVLAHMVMAIHPKSHIEADPDYFFHPVSAGPYVLKDWNPGASMWILESNPHYVRGPMAISKIEFVAVPDQMSRVLQLATGILDYAYDLPVTARSILPAEVKTYPVPLYGQFHVAFNLGLPSFHPLRNQNVRHAISLAIDRDKINQRVFGGISTPAKSFLYPGPPEALPILPYGGKRNLKRARELLDSTPFANGFSVSLETWGQRAGWLDASLVISENLADLGIDVQVRSVEDAVGVANFRAGRYEMEFAGNASSGPLEACRSLFVPGSFAADGFRYDNPVVTKLIDLATAAVAPDKRIELFHEAQRLVFEDMPIIPISERVVLVGNRISRDILFEAIHSPGLNPMVAALQELTERHRRSRRNDRSVTAKENH